MSTVDLDSMSYKDVIDHLNGRREGDAPTYTRASSLSEAERQVAFDGQMYARGRFRDLWIPRRDSMRAIFQHKMSGMSLAFNAATNITAFAFNSRNPMALVSNAFRLAVSTASEISSYMRKGKHVKEDAANMQNLIWDHVNNDIVNILKNRPIQDNGEVLENPVLRGHLVGVMNDDLVLKPRVIPNPDTGQHEVNHDARRIVARLLDCQYDETTGKLKLNEEVFGRRYATAPAPLEPKAPVAEAPAPAAPAPRAPVMAMAPA